ncbi:MAG: DsbA family protein [Actinomycetota bacterium]|nr:DsbA family protein [Actinomycetota bacterium]
MARVELSMDLGSFALTYDYRCPFARNAHEHVVAGLRAGAPWDVRFAPFSLSQAHVEEGEVPVWDDPARKPDLLAVSASLVVREERGDRFVDVHAAMFSARHDQGRDLRDPAVVRDVLRACDVDGDAVLAAVHDGWPVELFRKEHEAMVAEHQVFGVPTFVVGDQAAFVRLMSRPAGDGHIARVTIDRVLALVGGVPDLNELKHTTVPR